MRGTLEISIPAGGWGDGRLQSPLGPGRPVPPVPSPFLAGRAQGIGEAGAPTPALLPMQPRCQHRALVWTGQRASNVPYVSGEVPAALVLIFTVYKVFTQNRDE